MQARKRGRPKLPVEEHNYRLKLYGQGMTDKEIAERIGLTPRTVYRWRAKWGLRANPEKPGVCDRQIRHEVSKRPANERALLRRFLSDLVRAVERTRGKLDVIKFMNVWRDAMGAHAEEWWM